MRNSAFPTGQPPLVYREVAPCPALAPWVQTFRVVKADGATVGRAPVMRTMPDGCAELVLNLGGAIVDLPSQGHALVKPSFFLMGPLSRTRMARATGAIDAVSVLFKPGALGNFLRAPVDSLCDAVIAADGWPQFPASLAGQLASEPTARGRIRLLERHLIGCVKRQSPGRDALVEHALSRIAETSGGVRVQDLARELGWSERQVERRFRAAVGLSPKAYARTVRFCRALESMVKEVSPARSVLGFMNGFTDQSHLIREFRAIADATPRSYLSELHRADIIRGLDADVGIVRCAAGRSP